MFSIDQLHKLKNEFSNSLPIKELFMSWLKDLNLVTREEFDIQTKVLMKTRAKLEELEKKVQELTQTINDYNVNRKPELDLQ